MRDRPRGSELTVDVVVRRGDFRLAVDLRVGPDEVVAVLGPNGSGKSTLVGAIAGLLHPDAGHVRLGERTLTDAGDGILVPAHRRRVGLLAQQPLLFPHLSALDNVAFGPRSVGTGRAEARETARHRLADVDALELASRRPGELSGGQAARVALARALAPEPEALLLDEPFAALDVDATPAMRSLLRKVVRERGQATILVTHDVLDAVVLADRLVVLADGGVVESGATAEVLARPRSAFTARLAGLDLVPGRSCPDGLVAADGTVVGGTHPTPLPEGESAVAVFSPASVAVHRSRPHGSPRTVLAVRLAALEPRGELVRLRAGAVDDGPGWVEGLAADVTPGAVAELGAEPGARLYFVVKAAEVAIYPR